MASSETWRIAGQRVTRRLICPMVEIQPCFAISELPDGYVRSSLPTNVE